MSLGEVHNSTPPPALTWLHLLPSDARLEVEGGPDWFAAMAAENSSASGRPLRLKWDNASGLTTSRHGFVAINCPRLSPEALRSSGFAYVRRFAAIPNLRQTRWLVPLDSPAIASAAFSLYTPTRLSAKLKRWGVRLATHTRLPVWYRDTVCVTLPEAPPVERALAGIFPNQTARLAMSSGAPEGARNRKASALVIGQRGETLAFAKLARSAIARGILANEARVLPLLSNLAVPRLLLDAEVDGTHVLAQSPLDGRPAPLPLGEAHQEFLRSLQTQRRVPAAATDLVAGLPRRLSRWPELFDVLSRTLRALESFSIPVTVVHGDFAPWNLRLHEGKITAFDWEYAELSGLPLMDEIHYRLQVGMMLENWDVPAAGRFLGEFAGSRPQGFGPEQVDAIATVYLLDALARLLGENYGEDHEMIAWHRGLLDRLAPRAGAVGKGVAA